MSGWNQRGKNPDRPEILPLKPSNIGRYEAVEGDKNNDLIVGIPRLSHCSGQTKQSAAYQPPGPERDPQTTGRSERGKIYASSQTAVPFDSNRASGLFTDLAMGPHGHAFFSQNYPHQELLVRR